MDAELGKATIVNVSCARLIRVDFIAAGDLLNWVLARRSENRTVHFIEAHRMVALFFGAMGINEHAKVKVRTDLSSRVGPRLESSRRRHNLRPDGTLHGTTIVSVRRGNVVALGGDGQVTLGNIVVKATARKVRRLHHDQVLAGFAGATADAFTLFERFEAKLEKHQGHLVRVGDRADQGLAHRPRAAPARGDARRRRPRVVADHHRQRRRARARVRHRRDRLGRRLRAAPRRARCSQHTELAPSDIVKHSLEIAGDLCIYTNQNHTIETLE